MPRFLAVLGLPIAAAGLLAAGCASVAGRGDAEGAFTSATPAGLTLVASQPALRSGASNLTVQLWARPDRHAGRHFRTYEQLTLTLRSDADRGAGQAPGLRLPARYPDRDCFLDLRCVDLNADGTDEIILTEGYSGCGWSPGRHAVFAIEGGRIVPVGEFATEELDCDELAALPDGRRAIPCTYAIGEMAHCAQPRWSDYYSYDGARLVLVNRALPEAFRAWPEELTRELAGHPHDAELWYFLGRAHLVLGDDRQALACFRQADALGYSAHQDEAGAFNRR